MTEKLKRMGILAHPDDESLGFGGTLAKYRRHYMFQAAAPLASIRQKLGDANRSSGL